MYSFYMSLEFSNEHFFFLLYYFVSRNIVLLQKVVKIFDPRETLVQFFSTQPWSFVQVRFFFSVKPSKRTRHSGATVCRI